MAYTKTTWVDRQVPKPLTFSYPLVDNGDGTTTLVPQEGTPTATGTPITATALNNLETQYDSAMNDVSSLGKALTQIAPSYFNGWVDNSSSYPSYYVKDATGTVFYYFYMKNGSTSVNVVPLNLPAGYKPQTSMTMRGYADGGTGGNDIIYHITSGGEVKFLRTFTIPVGNFVILQGSFKAGS